MCAVVLCCSPATSAAAVLPLPQPTPSRCGTWACLACTATHRVSLGARPFTHPLGSVECLNHCLCWAYRRWDCALLGGRCSWPNCLPTNSPSLLCWGSLVVALCCAAAKLFFFLSFFLSFFVCLFVCVCLFFLCETCFVFGHCNV